jgi:hypothetical protein
MCGAFKQNGLGVRFPHALKKRLDVSATIAKIDTRCHSRFSDRPHGKAGKDLFKLNHELHIESSLPAIRALSLTTL